MLILRGLMGFCKSLDLNEKMGKMKNTNTNILITTNAIEKGGFLEIPYSLAGQLPNFYSKSVGATTLECVEGLQGRDG
ncbi:MAG: hypothetical protein LBJ67_15250 [Planctomycetaceae bacterium]|jgi:hypothetical protein|nr:hypothetical protein [Planctomycetaceae bacterium]